MFENQVKPRLPGKVQFVAVANRTLSERIFYACNRKDSNHLCFIIKCNYLWNFAAG